MNKMKLFEMAKAAQERMLDRLPINKKYIFLIGRFLELHGDHNTMTRLKQYLESRLTPEEFNMDNICGVFGVDPAAKHTDAGTRNNDNSFASVFHARFETLYNNMKNSLARSKDDIDKNYVDKVLDFYSAVYNHENPQEAYDRLNMGPVIDWIKDNKTEAEERFGRRWDKIQRVLAQWLDDNYEGSTAQAVANFWAWWRQTKDENPDALMPIDLARRLARVFCEENSREVLGNFHNFILKKVLVTLTADDNGVPGALKARVGQAVRDGDELGRMTDYCRNLVNTWFGTEEPTDEQLEEMRNRGNDEGNNANVVNEENYEDTIDDILDPADTAKLSYAMGAIHPDDIPVTLGELAEQLKDYVDYDKVGKVDRATVKAAFMHFREKVTSKEFRIGNEIIVNERLINSIQEFYNNYKNIFKIGLTQNGLFSIFDGLLTHYYEQRNKEIDDEWGNKQYDDVPDDYELEEALRVLHQNGFMID